MKESKPIELEDMSQERARVLSAQEVKGDERKMRLYDNGGTSSTWSYATATWYVTNLNLGREATYFKLSIPCTTGFYSWPYLFLHFLDSFSFSQAPQPVWATEKT